MSQTPKRGLGKGFEALLPSDFDKTILLSPEDRIEKIPIGKIEQNPDQPRKHFDDTALEELASSIKRYGIIQPLLVTPKANGNYVIVAGERRFRAAKLARLDTVPAVIRERKELEQLEISLIENVQRVDLSALEQAVSLERLHREFNFTYADIAKRLGKGSSTVNNIVRLLGLPDNVKQALSSGKITEGHARQILAIVNDPEKQNYLLNAIIKHGWTVRQAEQFVTGLKSGSGEAKKARAQTDAETPQTKSLSKKLGTAVTLRRMAHGGKLEISYKDDPDLARIISSFK